jgi:hypothetical protein
MATDQEGKGPDQFVFDYSKYSTSSIPMEHLEDIRKTAIAPATNIITQIFLLVRVTVLVGIEWLRSRKINEEMLIQKQEYERKRVRSQRGDLEKDDLDQLRSET